MANIDDLINEVHNLVEAINSRIPSSEEKKEKEKKEEEKRVDDIKKRINRKKAEEDINIFNNVYSARQRAKRMKSYGSSMSRVGSRLSSKNGVIGSMGKLMSGAGGVMSKLGGKLLGPLGLVADALGAIGNIVASIMKSIGQLKKLDTEQIFENIQYGFDTMMKNMETSTKIALEGKGIENKTLSAATQAHYSVIGGDLTDSAYAAANNMVDLMAEGMNFEQNRILAETEKESYHKVRGQENINKNNIIEARRTQTQVGMVTGGVDAVAGAIPVVGDAVKGITNAVNAGLELNTQMVENEATLSKQRVDNETKLYNTKVKFATDLQKLEIQRLTDLKKQQLKYAQGIEKQFLNFDKQSTRMGLNLGITDKTELKEFKHTMLETQIIMSKWGKNIEEINQIQSTYAEETGRNINLSQTDFDKTFALGNLLGDDGLANTLNASMNIFNQSVSSSNDMFFEMYQRANKMGISTQKYSKDLVKNLKLAEKYQFKGGVKNLMEMAAWAQRTRFNMDSLNSMLDKVHEGGLEGIITQSAQLQVLGGPAAMGSDPLAMLWESYNDPEAYAKRMQNMTSGIGRFDKKTGQTVFNQADQMRIEAMSKAQGRSKEDLLNEVRERNKRNDINKNLNPNITNQEQKEFIGSRAQWENGQWMVTMKNGDKTSKTSVNNLTENDIKNIMPIETEKRIEEYVKEIRDEIIKNKEVTTKNEFSLLEEKFNDIAVEQEKRREITEIHFKEQFDNYIKDIQEGITSVTNSFKDSLDLYSDNINPISEAMSKASDAMNRLTDTLSKIHGITNEEIEKFENLGNPKDMSEMTMLDKIERMRNLENIIANAKESYGKDVTDGYEWKNFFEGKEINGITATQEQQSAWKELKELINNYNNSIADYNKRNNTKLKRFDLTRNLIAEDSYKTLWGSGIMERFITNDNLNITGNTNEILTNERRQKNINDGVLSSNNQPMFTKASNLPYNSFNGSINASGSIEPKPLNYSDLPYNSFNGSINASGSIEPKPLNYSDLPYNSFNGDNVVNGYTNHNRYYSGSPTFGDGNIKIEPIKLEMSGKLELTNNGQTIDIIKELENNPLIIRAITKMISEGISQKINGGRAIYNGGNLVSF